MDGRLGREPDLMWEVERFRPAEGVKYSGGVDTSWSGQRLLGPWDTGLEGSSPGEHIHPGVTPAGRREDRSTLPRACSSVHRVRCPAGLRVEDQSASASPDVGRFRYHSRPGPPGGTEKLFLTGASGVGWAGVVTAALGSSAVGAVVGGMLTTWLRGRLEREEAWRTRLIEAADDVATALSQADLDFNAILVRDVAEARRPLRDLDGTFTKEVAESLTASMNGIRRANRFLTRVELLYGRESAAYAGALDAVYGLSGSVRLLEGNPRAQRAVQAALAERRGDNEERHRLIADDDVAESRYRALISRRNLPDDFDPDDGISAARWALRLHEGAVASFRAFMKGAHDDSRAPHPGRIRRRTRAR